MGCGELQVVDAYVGPVWCGMTCNKVKSHPKRVRAASGAVSAAASFEVDPKTPLGGSEYVRRRSSSRGHRYSMWCAARAVTLATTSRTARQERRGKKKSANETRRGASGRGRRNPNARRNGRSVGASAVPSQRSRRQHEEAAPFSAHQGRRIQGNQGQVIASWHALRNLCMCIRVVDRHASCE